MTHNVSVSEKPNGVKLFKCAEKLIIWSTKKYLLGLWEFLWIIIFYQIKPYIYHLSIIFAVKQTDNTT